MSISRVVILGHSGFIGSAVVSEFKIRSPDVPLILRSFPEFDITDRDQVMSLQDFCGMETMIIMIAGIKRQIGDTLDILESNIRMAANLGRLIENHPVAKLLYISSAAVYGEEVDNLAISEETPVHPESLYGTGKFAGECLLCRMMSGVQGGSLICLRPPVVYGPGDAAKVYGPSGFINAAISGKDIVMWGDGSELREFLFVEDLARIIWRLMSVDYSGPLNAASGISHNFQDVIRSIEQCLQYRLKVIPRPRSRKKVDNQFKADRLRRILPDFTFTSLESGIKKTILAEK